MFRFLITTQTHLGGELWGGPELTDVTTPLPRGTPPLGLPASPRRSWRRRRRRSRRSRRHPFKINYKTMIIFISLRVMVSGIYVFFSFKQQKDRGGTPFLWLYCYFLDQTIFPLVTWITPLVIQRFPSIIQRSRRHPFARERFVWEFRNGTNGVSTNGGTAQFMLFAEGLFGYSHHVQHTRQHTHFSNHQTKN